MKRALILGVGGQDGSYLAEILLGEGYEVHGLYRRSSVDNLRRITGIRDRLTLHRGDLLDAGSLEEAILQASPGEIYNLADQDDANWSGEIPKVSFDVTAGAVGTILELIRNSPFAGRQVKFFQPLSVLMFGDAPPPQTEETPLKPMSPYACAKAAAWHLCQHYRREHGLFVSCGIMFNHDSPGRSTDYVLQKICEYAAGVGKTDSPKHPKLHLKSLSQRLDVGFARDYMEAAHAILQLEEPDDFCVCTGEGPSIEEMVTKAFTLAGVLFGAGLVVSENLPASPARRGDHKKLTEATGWLPKTSLDELIAMIVDHYKEQP